MIYSRIIRSEAERDFEESATWYEDRKPGLGLAFIKAVEQTFDEILAHPKKYAIVKRSVRAAAVDGFPYFRVLYRIDSATIVIIAIFHSSRNPAEWMSRT